MNDVGIYEIVNVINGKRYVGSSASITERLKKHKSLLSRGKHKEHIQKEFNEYGKEAFKFRIIQYCNVNDLLEIEKMHIDKKSEYNICKYPTNKFCGSGKIPRPKIISEKELLRINKEKTQRERIAKEERAREKEKKEFQKWLDQSEGRRARYTYDSIGRTKGWRYIRPYINKIKETEKARRLFINGKHGDCINCRYFKDVEYTHSNVICKKTGRTYPICSKNGEFFEDKREN